MACCSVNEFAMKGVSIIASNWDTFTQWILEYSRIPNWLIPSLTVVLVWSLFRARRWKAYTKRMEKIISTAVYDASRKKELP